MTKPIRFTSAASLVALASVVAGCAAPQTRVVTNGFGGKANGEIGLATRALAALNSNDLNGAVGLAERAVERTPDDAGFRAILGNAYFAAGRFASAEAAYKDALAIYPNQPQVVLKLVLAQIGQGKNGSALGVLDSNRDQLDPADFGLAMALAGRAADAIPVLETAARLENADGRVRQNLALAYAFAGDWNRARTVAAQDVSADKLDERMQQWMQLANPAKASDQVAALTGITPAAADPGQPVRLALRQPDAQMATAAPAPAPQPAFVEASAAAPSQPVEAAPQPQFAEAAPPPPPPPPAVVEAPAPVPPPSEIAMMAAAAPEAPAAFAAFAPKAAAPKPAKLHRASVTAKVPAPRKAALRTGKSNAVVQLGAYGSRDRVAQAWNTLTRRYPALRAHLPMTARFNSPKGTFYRLSIQGFASQQEAIARCNLLKSRGGNCFVRNVAGDTPIQIASR
jgi:Flp pilus assembly protein TadD